MRMTVGILGSIVMLGIGFVALSESAQQAYEPAVINGTNASASAYNMSVGVVEGVGGTAATALPYAGIGAIVLVSLGLLYLAVPRGGRR